MWHGLPRWQSCDVQQEQGEGLSKKPSKKECSSDLLETELGNPLFDLETVPRKYLKFEHQPN